MIVFLAQTSQNATGLELPSDAEAYSVFFWSGLIIVAAILMGMVSLAIRKRLMRPDEPDAGGTMGFTLADLRRMHDDGHLTDDEYIQAKRRLIATTRAELAADDEEADGHAVHIDGTETPPADDDEDDVPF